MPVEISIKASNDEKALVSKHLVYDPVVMDVDNAFLKDLVRKTIDEFGKDVEDVTIKTKMVWR